MAKTYHALLDAFGVYQGVVPSTGKLEPGFKRGIEVDRKCDLEPGKYRWDEDEGTFKPIPKSEVKKLPPVSALTAIAQGFKSLSDAGHSFDSSVLDWVDEQLSSTDSIADWDKGR